MNYFYTTVCAKIFFTYFMLSFITNLCPRNSYGFGCINNISFIKSFPDIIYSWRLWPDSRWQLETLDVSTLQIELQRRSELYRYRACLFLVRTERTSIYAKSPNFFSLITSFTATIKSSFLLSV